MALTQSLIHALMQCVWPIGSLVHIIVISGTRAHWFLEQFVDDSIDSHLLLASSIDSDSTAW